MDGIAIMLYVSSPKTVSQLDFTGRVKLQTFQISKYVQSSQKFKWIADICNTK